MDIVAAAFSIYGQILPIVASTGAGLATFALLAGTAKLARQKDSALPNDPELAQAKYALAFAQLEEQSDDQEAVMRTAEKQSAVFLAFGAFDKYKTHQQSRKKNKT